MNQCFGSNTFANMFTSKWFQNAGFQNAGIVSWRSDFFYSHVFKSCSKIRLSEKYFSMKNFKKYFLRFFKNFWFFKTHKFKYWINRLSEIGVNLFSYVKTWDRQDVGRVRAAHPRVHPAHQDDPRQMRRWTTFRRRCWTKFGTRCATSSSKIWTRGRTRFGTGTRGTRITYEICFKC